MGNVDECQITGRTSERFDCWRV